MFYRRSRTSQEPEETLNTDLRRHLSGKLPAYMLPAGMLELDRFPITPNGKTDRKALSNMKITRTSSGVPPQTQLERDLAKVWKRVLKTNTVGVHDNFFETYISKPNEVMHFVIFSSYFNKFLDLNSKEFK